MCEWWVDLKKCIKLQSIRFAKQLSFKKKLNVRLVREKLEKEILEFEENQMRDTIKYLALKEELLRLENEKWVGEQIRSKAKYIVDGEKPAAYFLNLERAKQKRMYINELETNDGKKVRDFVDAIGEIDHFYRDLFKKEEVDKDRLEITLNSVKERISNDDKITCDMDITVEEIIYAIDGMKANKSPGIDGLIHKFYKEFKHLLAPLL